MLCFSFGNISLEKWEWMLNMVFVSLCYEKQMEWVIPTFFTLMAFSCLEVVMLVINIIHQNKTAKQLILQSCNNRKCRFEKKIERNGFHSQGFHSNVIFDFKVYISETPTNTWNPWILLFHIHLWHLYTYEELHWMLVLQKKRKGLSKCGTVWKEPQGSFCFI